MTVPVSTAPYIDRISSVFPEVQRTEFQVSTTGWDSVALIGGGFVFKFPRHEQAALRLRREAKVLAILCPRVRMRLPDLKLHDHEGQLFSSHAMIPGRHLLPSQYGALTADAKLRLARELALFFADVHAIDQHLFRAAGTSEIPPWPHVDDIRRLALPLLPRKSQPAYDAILTAYANLAPDPHGTVFGMFDTHGWNMAFDHTTQQLNGIYDLGDSGFGPCHLDFMPVAKIALDLAQRVIADYMEITGRRLDQYRIKNLSGMNRIIEVFEELGNATIEEKCAAAVQWLDEGKNST